MYHDRQSSSRRQSHHVIRQHRPSKDTSIGTDTESVLNLKPMVRPSNCPPCPPCDDSKRTSAQESQSEHTSNSRDSENGKNSEKEECEKAIKCAVFKCQNQQVKDGLAKEGGDVGSASTTLKKKGSWKAPNSDDCKPKKAEECQLSEEDESAKAGQMLLISLNNFG